MTAGEAAILEEVRAVRKDVGKLGERVTSIETRMSERDKANDNASTNSGNMAAWVAAGCAVLAVVLHFLPSPAKGCDLDINSDKSTRYTNGTLCEVMQPDF